MAWATSSEAGSPLMKYQLCAFAMETVAANPKAAATQAMSLERLFVIGCATPRLSRLVVAGSIAHVGQARCDRRHISRGSLRAPTGRARQAAEGSEEAVDAGPAVVGVRADA